MGKYKEDSDMIIGTIVDELFEELDIIEEQIELPPMLGSNIDTGSSLEWEK